MKRTAKIIMLLLALAMVFSLAACGNEDEGTKNNGNEPAQSGEGESDSDVVAKTASGYPAKTIRVICPWAAGGGTDIAARLFVEAANKYSDVELVVENVTGSSGTYGMTEMLNSKADGYTIAYTTTGPQTIQPWVGNSTNTPDKMIPVIGTSYVPAFLAVSKDSEIDDYNELVEYAKTHPGEFKIGGPGNLAYGHLTAEIVAREAGFEFKYVPFDGGSAAIAALLGGHVDAVSSTSTDAIPYLESGDLKIIWLTDKSPIISDVPTLKDLGIDVEMGMINAIYVPADTPQEVVDYLAEVFHKGMEDESMKEHYENKTIDNSYMSGEEVQEAVTKEYEMFGKLLTEMGYVK